MKKLSIFLVLGLSLAAVCMAQAKMEITYWTHEDPNRTEIENRYIEVFEKANPGVVVKRVTNPSKKMAERILTAFAANSLRKFRMSRQTRNRYSHSCRS